MKLSSYIDAKREQTCQITASKAAGKQEHVERSLDLFETEADIRFPVRHFGGP